MNITKHLQDAVGKYRSTDENGSNGAKGLAPVLGITAGSLSHKVSPTYPGAHCSPDEVVGIVNATGDHGPIQAMAVACGGVFLPNIQSENCDSTACQLITRSVKEFGEWLAAANAAQGPDPLTDTRMAEVEKELLEAIQEAMRLHASLRAKHLADKPAHLREVRAA